MSTAEQYNVIRTSIASNLATIKSLLEQADSLYKIISDLDDTIEKAEKVKLENNIDSIYRNIDMLIVQTDTLLKTFIKYAKAKEGED